MNNKSDSRIQINQVELIGAQVESKCRSQDQRPVRSRTVDKDFVDDRLVTVGNTMNSNVLTIAQASVPTAIYGYRFK